MFNYELPYDVNRFDVLCGTVISTNRVGIEILLDCEQRKDRKLSAFAFCNGTIGQRVVVSIKNYNAEKDNFRVTVDSFLPSSEEMRNIA